MVEGETQDVVHAGQVLHPLSYAPYLVPGFFLLAVFELWGLGKMAI